MTDFVDQAETARDAGSPVNEDLVNVLYGNAVFAARSSWHPYDRLIPRRQQTGDIWRFSDDGPSPSIETPVFESGFEYALVFEAVEHDSSTQERFDLEVRGSTDATYYLGSFSALASATAPYSRVIGLPLPEFPVDTVVPTAIAGFPAGQTPTADIALPTTQGYDRARISFNSGSHNFNAGAVRLLRRRAAI